MEDSPISIFQNDDIGEEPLIRIDVDSDNEVIFVKEEPMDTSDSLMPIQDGAQPYEPRSPIYPPPPAVPTHEEKLRRAAEAVNLTKEEYRQLIRDEVLNQDQFSELQEVTMKLECEPRDVDHLLSISFVHMKSCDFCNTVNEVPADKAHEPILCRECRVIIPHELINIIHDSENSNDLQVNAALMEQASMLHVASEPPKPRKRRGKKKRAVEPDTTTPSALST